MDGNAVSSFQSQDPNLDFFSISRATFSPNEQWMSYGFYDDTFNFSMDPGQIDWAGDHGLGLDFGNSFLYNPF